jgi:hypothetical protein
MINALITNKPKVNTVIGRSDKDGFNKDIEQSKTLPIQAVVKPPVMAVSNW